VAWRTAPATLAGHSLLREYRGDRHIAALTGAELSGIEAHITFIATGRGFTPAVGAELAGLDRRAVGRRVDNLRCRGLLADGTSWP
jgi:hypothetical protein